MEKKKTKKIKNIVTEKTETVINSDGEVLEERSSKTRGVEKEPDFIKLYLEDITQMLGIAPAFQKVFISLAKHMGYTNMVVLIKAVKEQIALELGLSLNTVDAAIKALKNNGLLLKYKDAKGEEKKSCWIVNPNIAAKGKWEDIKCLRLQIDYTLQGKSVKVITNPNKTHTIQSSYNKNLYHPDIQDSEVLELSLNSNRESKETEEKLTAFEKRQLNLFDDEEQQG